MAEEKELEGPLYKNNAFQWAQTIARQCGPEQLKQQLPHFGDNSDDELRDYLVIKSEEERKGHRRGISRAFAFQMRKYPSAGDDAVLSDDSGHLALAGRLRQRLRRVSSAAELETAAKVVALDPTPDNLSTSLTGLPDTMESGLSREVADRERISVVESSSQNSFTSRLSLSTVCEATSQCKEVTTTPRETSKNMPQPPVEGYYEAHAEEAS